MLKGMLTVLAIIIIIIILSITLFDNSYQC